MEFLPSLEAFLEAGFILFVTVGTLAILNGVRILVRNKCLTEEDFWGDKIKGRWTGLVKPGARHLLHAFANKRCNFCGQKNFAQLEYRDPFGATSTPGKPVMLNSDNTRDYLCGSCGVKLNTSLYEVEGKVLRECTDPIPELRRPATHACVLPDGLEVRINVCKTCDGDKWVSVPSSVNTGELWGEYVKARCPDCYTRNDPNDSVPIPASLPPVPVMSARRMAIAHTKAKWHESEKRSLQ